MHSSHRSVCVGLAYGGPRWYPTVLGESAQRNRLQFCLAPRTVRLGGMKYTCWVIFTFSLVLVAQPIYAQSAPGRLTLPQRKLIAIPATSTLGDTETDTTIVYENRDRRERARFLTRFAVGGGYGFADQLDSGGLLMEAHLGLRQQLTSLFGLHVQLLAVFGLRDYVQRSEDGTVTRSELGAAVTPYIGPLGRFYVGPAAFLGYRWYTFTTSLVRRHFGFLD
jgi:hypothetical protein